MPRPAAPDASMHLPMASTAPHLPFWSRPTPASAAAQHSAAHLTARQAEPGLLGEELPSFRGRVHFCPGPGPGPGPGRVILTSPAVRRSRSRCRSSARRTLGCTEAQFGGGKARAESVPLPPELLERAPVRPAPLHLHPDGLWSPNTCPSDCS